MATPLARRRFLSALGTAAALPFAARAQSSDHVRRIGVLPTGYRQTDTEGEARIGAFAQVLAGLGWRDGQNVRLEVRWPGNEVDQIRAEASALAASTPDVFVVSSNAALTVLKRLNQTIPTVFVQVSDPVGGGYVESLAQPGANVTGFQNFEPAVGGKWLGLLKEAAPGLAQAAVTVYADTAAHSQFLRAVEAVAPSLSVRISVIDVREGDDLERGIAEFAKTPNGGLIFLPHPRSIDHRIALAEQAARLRLPAIYPFRYFAVDGGLMSYGFDQVEQWRGAAVYVDRILRGAKTADLPVQAPTKYDLVINLKTAKALGLAMPPSLLATAAEVIE